MSIEEEAMNSLFNPPADPVKQYADLITDEMNTKITLDKEQQALVLAIHDYGLEIINDDNIHILYSILSDIKNKIFS